LSLPPSLASLLPQNNLSYSSNAYMQALSVVSIVFIPATFLS